MWKSVDGDWRYTYRVSDAGEVQKQNANGSWKTLNQHLHNGDTMRVGLKRKDGLVKHVSVSKIVADAFLGGTPPGMCRVHRNRSKRDNAVENIIFMTKAAASKRQRPGNSLPVLKLDRDGEVVGAYCSVSEAARHNYISLASIARRCRGEVSNPYDLDGFNSVYDLEE